MLKMPNTKTALQLCAWVSIVLLAGCVSQSTTPDGQSNASEQTVDGLVDQRLDQAQALLDDYQINEAEVILSGLQFNQLTTAQRTRYAQLRAELALSLGDGNEALNWLSGERAALFDGLPLEQQIVVSLLRAEAYEYSGDYLSAARERIFLAPVLEDDNARFNNEQIWFDLQLVPEEPIRELSAAESSPDLTGWLDLALIARENPDDLRRQVIAIDEWINSHPSHPAAQNIPGDLALLRQLANTQPRNIAVLLPLSGPLEMAGKAIRSGLLAAWYESRLEAEDAPSLTFFDTNENADAYNTYKQAVFEGADLVIGPLDKARVQQIQQQTVLSVPVLALNYSDLSGNGPSNFYQFGLAPEDEARQVAEQAWQQGNRNAMVLAPDSEWGRKVSDTFVRNWETQGGRVTSKSLYTQPDQYLNTVRRALNIDQSERRMRSLDALIERDIIFEPRRREDIDMIFMVAFPSQARQLKPMLNFQYASDIPVMATSHLYDGTRNTSRDQDLNGVAFVEMPWELRENPIKQDVQSAFNEQFAGFETLVALGVDSYRLYPRLPQLQQFPDTRVYGVTGTLRLDARQRIERELTWAQFSNGEVRPGSGLVNVLNPASARP
ncbi:penicillin-binding protein activator [Saccharospirillum impatiens]|uniref:penicillin-binding protein activator n=1 Tax=Saccharospirillum impatiens TaxID=169438 RepID=UPI000418AB15|nr:penicillin-binding protein activator [Saccharospirillum impatiens]